LQLRRRREGSGRFLKTVLFVDIAGSTELAASIGDAAWQNLLERYYAAVRDRLRRFGGRQIDTAGDGLFAEFDVPADGVACALSIRDAAATLGFPVRAGLHMGEVQTIEGKVGGIAVHIGARIAGVAEPGQVLVSSTVKDLVVGSQLQFEDRGETALKGVPGTWRLFLAQAPEPDAVVVPETRRPPLAIPRSRTAVVLLVLALVAVAGGAYLAFRPSTSVPGPSGSPGSSTPSEAPIAVVADSVARMDATGRVVGSTHVGALPDGIAFGEGSLWITNTTDGTVARLDASGAQLIQTIDVGSSPSGIASGFGAIWVANGGDRTVSRINPSTNKAVGTVTVGNAPSGIATDDHWVWVTNRLDGTVSRFAPDGGDVETFNVGQTLLGIAVGAGAVWVTDFDSGVVIRLDQKSGAETDRIHVGHGPSAIAASAAGVWVVNALDGNVSRIDPATDSIRATTLVGDEPTGIGVGPSGVWVAVSSTSEMVHIDPATDQIAGRLAVGATPQGVAMNGDSPFFTARAAETDHRGGTLKIVSDASSFPTSPDPAYGTFNPDLVLFTNDGLVAFKRVGGPDGLTLVPDLAAALPVVSDAGLTYQFRLRPGIAYSNGTTVRASDVLASWERIPVTEIGNPFTENIVGGETCTSITTCDLSKGIAVDDQAGTVTIRLKVADPSFLYNIAGWQAAILPADTPRAESKTPLPATGPYMFETYSPSLVRIVRNPHFKEWSRSAQPDGYPDAIEWTSVPDGTDPSSLVESGQADYSADPLTPARLKDLATRLTGQLNVAPSLQTFFELMNTRIAPFKDPSVRRAINLATDRQAVVDAYGGPLQARITCQAVPPAFAGYEPYCPYTVSPDSGGTWRGPDLATARALIDKAGVKGERVVVYGLDLPGHAEVARYFTALLNQLGFKATTKIMELDAYFTLLSGPTDVQMAGFWVQTAAPTASNMIPGLFTCPDFSAPITYLGYPSEFCDRAIDAQVEQALALETTGDRSGANALWAKIDRAVVDAAPAVMVLNPTDVTFVSKRVGNFQHHPQWQILLDQLWVK
jgi:peptide/nickel transport system substrate-binding protein